MNERVLGQLIQLRDPLLQRMDLAAPWGARVPGCDNPGMYVVHRGRVHFRVEHETTELAAGDIVLLPAGGPHVLCDAVGTAPRSLAELFGRVERDGIAIRVSGPGPQTVVSAIPFADASPLTWLPRRLIVRRRDLDRLSASLVEAYDHALDRGEADVLARVAEALWIKIVAERVPEVQTADLAVLRAAADVLERPERVHTLRSLARRAGLSRSRFSARFTVALGESPMRWVQTVRMRHAQALLQGGTQSVAAVAEQLGFDESAFRKAYRRILGRPPRAGLG